ncbi:MAG: hypothetical protein Q9182_000047 [Xanthomendoza sp. 2 TL-2023]
MAQSVFFDQYPNFRQRHTAPILNEFRRLAQTQGWRKVDDAWKINRQACLQAEFEFHFGSIETENKLAGWQNLCQELGVDGDTSSIAKCKKALRQVHVNILDFIDDRRAHRQVQLYHSAGELARYTRDHKRFFPLGDTEGAKLIKILLRYL